MDSLTQITLGAAVGEIVLGKKVGNRAVLWGAVGGTIPDLDVIAGAFLDPLQELAAHRGFSHSIVFSVLGAFLFGWMIHQVYKSSYHRYFAVVGWLLIPVGVVYFISRIFDNASFSSATSISLGLIVLLALYGLFVRYFKKGVPSPGATIQDWQWLMFWALFTHPLLDCFTTYGTQLFLPFSDYRVAFNTVAVADPFYTVPFLVCVIALSFLNRQKTLRSKLAWTGITVSSLYLILCTLNKQRVNKVWTNTLAENQIEYSRYMTSPAILSNLLWTCTAEVENGYYSGVYSIFDKKKTVDFEFVERNPDSVSIPGDDPTFQCMKWFSNGYYTILRRPDGYQFNDLRFGSIDLDQSERHYIFNFIVKKVEDTYKMMESNGGPPPGGEREMLGVMIDRIKGI